MAFGLKVLEKNYDNSPDSKTAMNEMHVEDIVDPELYVFFAVTWSKFNQ